jgi:L-ascorbate metabolism protein UlaG (beta-lactamase superfamily)
VTILKRYFNGAKWSGMIAAALAAGCLLCAGAAVSGELAAPAPELFPRPARDAVTFWGHACYYIDVDGFGIVTDPVFDKATPGRHRHVGAPPRESYEGARLVLISHSHTDHLSKWTLATFPRGTVVLCPPSAAEIVGEAGLEARTMKPGDSYPFPGGRIFAVAAFHGGGRYGFVSSADGRALGWVIETPRGTVYYSGDTGYFEGFAEVGKRYYPDIAIINMNDHLKGREAASAALDTGARIVIPSHYGAYGRLFLKARVRPPDFEETTRILGPRLIPLDLGGSVPLPAKAPGAPVS